MILKKLIFKLLFKKNNNILDLKKYDWIYMSVYYDKKLVSGANIRFFELSRSIQNNNVLFISFDELKNKNFLIIKKFWNTKFRKQIAAVFIQLLFWNKVIHFDNFPWLKNKKHWYLMHDVGSLIPKLRRSGLMRSILFKFFLKKQQKIITVSNTSKNELTKFNISHKNIFVSYNSSSFLDLILKKEKKTFEFCLVTSGQKHKRDHDILNALIRLNVKVCVISNNHKFLKIYKKSQSIKTFLAPSENKKLELLQKSKFYISYSQIEGFGITVLEALCCKCVCILSKLDVFYELFYFSKNVHMLEENKDLFFQLKNLTDKDLKYIDEKIKLPSWKKISYELDLFLLSQKEKFK